MPVTETTAEPSTVAPTSYGPLLKRFVVRLCVAVTIALLILVATEFYAYLRVHPNVNALELAAKLEIQQNESPDRAAVLEGIQAGQQSDLSPMGPVAPEAV